MKHVTWATLSAALIVLTAGTAGYGAVAIVIEHAYTIGNTNFSAFAYNSLLNPNEFLTTGYGGGKDLRWSRVLDDTVEPWVMEGRILMDSGQIEYFARDGYTSYSLTYNAWGLSFNPLDSKYFLSCISTLKDPAQGNIRVDAERDLIMLDPRLPNSGIVVPNGVSVSNTGGVYTLIDSTLTSTNGFIASGVQVDDQLTMYPLNYSAQIYATTYTVTQLVSQNELRLDKDPLWTGSPTQSGNVAYILMLQPWITLGTMRDSMPYYANDLTAGPKITYPGGLSPDGGTLYIAENTTNNLLAVDTQQRETFSIYTSAETIHDYVLAQSNAGRRRAIINADRAYIDSTGLESGWSNQSTTTTVAYGLSTPVAPVGTKCMSAIFTAAGARLKLHPTIDVNRPARNTADYTHLHFWIHGWTTGGQTMNVNLWDATGVMGTAVAVPAPLPNTWTLVEIPIEQFGVSTIGDIVFDSTAPGAQPIFFLDDISLLWTDPLPPGKGMFDTNGAGPASAQIATDAAGVVWFSEGEADDILWTTNGTDLHPFLTSNEIAPAYIAAGALTPSTITATFSNGVQVMGMIIDQMGTVYWSDNQTRSIWKAPRVEPAAHIKQIGSKAELQAAMSLGTTSPGGLNDFSIRGTELLTYNFLNCNCVIKVDMNTFDYGDYDGDVDVDATDYGLVFQQCLAGPGVSTPPGGCTAEQFGWADLDDDNDVDLDDFREFQLFFTGPGPGETY